MQRRWIVSALVALWLLVLLELLDLSVHVIELVIAW